MGPPLARAHPAFAGLRDALRSARVPGSALPFEQQGDPGTGSPRRWQVSDAGLRDMLRIARVPGSAPPFEQQGDPGTGSR
ncbi:hypothetical protein NDU88_011552 [Pleurodeles waltl]|uniref:Uncharacterized protein n=1 Tax=Pleurodeles waltl TaxID=8319 RepID=A0AAV7QXY5_PLEWA|nr:hypothetical protein NDU88_011552 [Pleurodeles waltl]